jgi:hypothetical protein
MINLSLSYYEGGYALSSYISKQNYDDALSDTIRLMKNNDKFYLDDLHAVILQAGPTYYIHH